MFRKVEVITDGEAIVVFFFVMPITTWVHQHHLDATFRGKDMTMALDAIRIWLSAAK